jgi:hypothetical protein
MDRGACSEICDSGNNQRVTKGSAIEPFAGPRVKSFTEALQRRQPVRSALSLASAVADANGEPAMMKSLITTTILTLGLGFLSNPSFASTYIVNGRAASPAEAQLLVTNGVQPGAWVVNGYGIAPAERRSFTAPAATESNGKKCYYVLDVLLCD